MIQIGIIQDIYPPGHPMNLCGAQYAYLVVCRGDVFATTPYVAPRIDSSGSIDNFEDELLQLGQKVLVSFLYDNSTYPVIIGALRSAKKATDKSLGWHYKKRFNNIEQYIVKKEWHVKSDDGPNMFVAPDKIMLDNSTGESILLDKKNKIMTIKANTFKVVVEGNANIEVKGNSTIKTKGETKIISSIIKFMKSDGSDAIEPFVLGQTFVSMMTKLLQIFGKHRHLGNLGIPTTQPIELPEINQLLASPIQDKKILSDFIKGAKK